MRNIKKHVKMAFKQRKILKWSEQADQLDFKANEMLREGKSMEAKVLIAKANLLRSRVCE